MTARFVGSPCGSRRTPTASEEVDSGVTEGAQRKDVLDETGQDDPIGETPTDAMAIERGAPGQDDEMGATDDATDDAMDNDDRAGSTRGGA